MQPLNLCYFDILSYISLIDLNFVLVIEYDHNIAIFVVVEIYISYLVEKKAHHYIQITFNLIFMSIILLIYS
jgi:hypothetical protein